MKGNQYALGNKLTEEQRAKISAFMKGKKHVNRALTNQRILDECEDLHNMFDFKISPITVSDGCTKATVHVYEGNIATENEQSRDGLVPITRYRRANKVRSFQLDLSGEYSQTELATTAKTLMNATERLNIISQQQ